MPALVREHPELAAKLYGDVLEKEESNEEQPKGEEEGGDEEPKVDASKLEPWTMEQRLAAFYAKYEPTKVSSVPTLLTKYEGKEEALFTALTKKYGDEPIDPYLKAKYGITDGDSDDENEDSKPPAAAMGSLKLAQGLATQKVFEGKARGASVKATQKVETRIVLSKSKLQKKKWQTVVIGMETVEGLKLKDAAQAFRKRFAGSSSVKDGIGGAKEVIIQGDHVEEGARFIMDKFKVKRENVFMDIDGDFVNP
ncbi:hypothetical protein TrLO_g10612 [Triparma laevis f. longispina]|nr:hypothetical protein TrLO_g10612 [Triparma laevis f. longispina]